MPLAFVLAVASLVTPLARTRSASAHVHMSLRLIESDVHDAPLDAPFELRKGSAAEARARAAYGEDAFPAWIRANGLLYDEAYGDDPFSAATFESPYTFDFDDDELLARNFEGERAETR
ncbi:hypothetical protein KFE25_000978 [Diacronema lutheri]|uniref:Uncharacterized protein n=1 Tax=Diacronema lutheri TaxID=2081491 RepID=A0A8J6C2B9_DIALT|nr:hypothetical protein KFE25_000978 [Diacronema lutheri]